ncbi:DNA repair protein XRCC1 [Drosophila madeirensis]|uniref:DNA repair protein XRCC1 n=1 Tax=Drosophila madeirensis TaxID=30013 RepID=A0AAU9G4S6_DROMD
MPIAILKSVREVSSEDPVHVAENLLKENAGKKWKTQSVGEKSAYVILEFAEPQQVTGIDLGNEHSAFIEVLVSRTGCQVDDFKELLLSSSFMTPIESKNSSTQHRVRCFNSAALNATVLPDKWKLLKIVCTQPFNRHVQYGLSFVKVHVTATAAATAKPKSLLPERIMQFGAFKLREESPDSDTDTPSMRFKRWKESQQPAAPAAAPASTAAAIRDASAVMRRLSSTKSSSPAPATAAASRSESPAGEGKTAAKPLDRNRASLLFGDDDDDVEDDKNARKQRLSKHLEADKDRRRKEQEKQEQERKKEKSKRLSIDKAPPKVDSPKPKESSRKSPPAAAHKRHSSPTRSAATPAKKLKIKEATIQYRPFNQLLRGVVLVISGIQNPDRADLRSKATAMGARYKADWESGCTHLICAFKNTPKYREVRGKGKIVTRSWIEKCHAHKKYLPWRRYALDTDEVGRPESDEELHDESLKPKARPEPQLSDDIEMKANVEQIDEADHGQKKDTNVSHDVSSGIDTEDELERVAHENILRKAKDKQQLQKKPKSQDVYDISTDEEDYLEEKKKQVNAL